jgi:phosphoribosyl-ATP pyrophosphohydrolase/phosphoribosyl-AMP cyclohydrolase
VSENNWLSAVRFGADGLVPVVAQESRSGDVLMVAFANREALERTVATGLAHYYSRSRASLWQKGETSGHIQRVNELRLDCDGDAVLYRVEQTGPACHRGTATCFDGRTAGRRGDEAVQTGGRDHTGGQTGRERDPAGDPLARLAGTIARRAAERPEGSYTVKLLDRGVPAVSQKVGEEAVEVVVAANAEDDGRLASEAGDLLYHLLVLLQARGIPLERVWRELEGRTK